MTSPMLRKAIEAGISHIVATDVEVYKDMTLAELAEEWCVDFISILCVLDKAFPFGRMEMEVDKNTCKLCGAKLFRSHTVEDYLVWKCPNDCGDELEHFGEMNDESWEWCKQEARRGRQL